MDYEHGPTPTQLKVEYLLAEAGKQITQHMQAERVRVVTRNEQLEADNAKLRKALIGLVGAEKTEELAQMEHAIRMLPAPDEDKANTINAIHAIRDTSPNVRDERHGH